MDSVLNHTVLAETQTCPAVGYQSASICVPVTVTPFAQTGAPITKCCGNPVVTPGLATCSGVRNGACTFTIAQNICVAVPVEFGAPRHRKSDRPAIPSRLTPLRCLLSNKITGCGFRRNPFAMRYVVAPAPARPIPTAETRPVGG